MKNAVRMSRWTMRRITIATHLWGHMLDVPSVGIHIIKGGLKMDDKERIITAINFMIEDKEEKLKECGVADKWSRTTLYRHKGAIDALKAVQRYIGGME